MVLTTSLRCALTGFDAGWGQAFISYLQDEIDPLTGQIITKDLPELNLISARRRGVQLSYVRNRAYNGNGLNTFIGLPSGSQVIVEFCCCTFQQASPDAELIATAELGRKVPGLVKTYPSFPSCF